MPTYDLYGGALESALPLPSVPPTDARPADWELRSAQDPPAVTGAIALGTVPVDKGVSVTLWRSAEGWRLAYDDTGTFDIDVTGRHITWYPAPGAAEDLAELDVIGRVMAVALHASGQFVLHGSAVQTTDGIVGFMGPKFHGKSTLAWALARAGHPLVTDDALPVRCSAKGAVAYPGVASIRLWSDSAQRLSSDRSNGHQGTKHTISDLPDAQRCTVPCPLAAVYLLSPVDPTRIAEPAQRTALDGVRAALALVANAKIGALLGHREAATLTDRAARIANHVPVYVLEISRDFDRLDRVVQIVGGWHDGPGHARDGG